MKCSGRSVGRRNCWHFFFLYTKGKGVYLWREVYALRKKNVMYVIGEVILLPRLLIWNIHRIVIVKAGLAQWQIAHH